MEIWLVVSNQRTGEIERFHIAGQKSAEGIVGEMDNSEGLNRIERQVEP